ncbi:MAG TPA: Nif11-like leader peptide family RiPP precursor [Gaiellaceae bacterium]|nr:Nif11-like leader peptide family RiPP precursor [Gaiellaceae bacterium]
MSTEAAIAFVERLKTDEAFLSRIGNAASPAERRALAREEGFELSADDIGAVKEALGIEELSDEDLEKVSGGTGTTTSVVSSATWSVISAGAVVAGAAAAL